ncbi:MAG: hypothetical protein NT091_00055 [Candidatus Falkowbacteria bacterium]|nr:hypothetical protein [Candidatus Falkowbacteria bacterium]
MPDNIIREPEPPLKSESIDSTPREAIPLTEQVKSPEIKKEQPVEKTELPKETPVKSILPSERGLAGKKTLDDENKQHLKAIEMILEDGLGAIITTLDPQNKTEFINGGEKLAQELKAMLERSENKPLDMIKRITKWLEIAKIKNQNYLEQAAKIKTDQLLELKLTW